MYKQAPAPMPTQQIFEVFGWDGFPAPLFYQAQYALRFELGGQHANGPARFLQAIDRARRVVARAFAGSDDLAVFVACRDVEKRSSRQAWSFKALAGMGFRAAFGPVERVCLNDLEHIAEFGEDLCLYWRSAEIKNDPDQISVLLWASVAREMGIAPKAQWLHSIYMVDFRRGIVAYVYDDRGMDVVATSRDLLQPLYNQFGEWLLDYDREQMDNVFARE